MREERKEERKIDKVKRKMRKRAMRRREGRGKGCLGSWWREKGSLQGEGEESNTKKGERGGGRKVERREEISQAREAKVE